MAELIKGNNDLEAKFPNIANEWHPVKNGELLPCDVTPKSGKKVWWLGKCGHEWQDVIKNRCVGTGCPACSKRNKRKIKKEKRK